jgi:hypothetical protein
LTTTICKPKSIVEHKQNTHAKIFVQVICSQIALMLDFLLRTEATGTGLNKNTKARIVPKYNKFISRFGKMTNLAKATTLTKYECE